MPPYFIIDWKAIIYRIRGAFKQEEKREKVGHTNKGRRRRRRRRGILNLDDMRERERKKRES